MWVFLFSILLHFFSDENDDDDDDSDNNNNDDDDSDGDDEEELFIDTLFRIPFSAFRITIRWQAFCW